MAIRHFFDLLDSALVGVCDAGDCDDPAAAVLLTEDAGWLSMCNEHALRHLAAQATDPAHPAS
jgi:hypothetical protein